MVGQRDLPRGGHRPLNGNGHGNRLSGPAVVIAKKAVVHLRLFSVEAGWQPLPSTGHTGYVARCADSAGPAEGEMGAALIHSGGGGKVGGLSKVMQAGMVG